MPALRDLVLVGGGHAHVEVLRRFGMRPQPGVRLTLISRETHTPYSGMLPGQVAGRYCHDDIHIDLIPLAVYAGARFIADELVALNLATNRIELASHPDVRFDLLSLNTGTTPAVPGTGGIRVKPISRFLPQLDAIRAGARAGDTLALVGGGAAGVELALALRQTLPDTLRLVLLTDRLLPGLASGMKRALRRELEAHRIELRLGFRVIASTDNRLDASDGRSIEVDHLLWTTGGVGPAWASLAGLATDPAGFVQVDAHLNSLSHPQVFAAGDIACLDGQERPKAGVFAVRQGKVLAANLRRRLLDEGLCRYRAQRAHLVIVGTGEGRAVAARGGLYLSGKWVWRWKQWIDRRFMDRFHQLPRSIGHASDVLPPNLQQDAPSPMRCGGCGSKLGAGLLKRVLDRLPDQRAPGLLLGPGDDAAIVRNTGMDQLLSVDGFPGMISDPYRFGRIVAHHCLNDLIAMGGQGRYALAYATIPLMAETMMEEELYTLLLGAVEVLNSHNVHLVGGHSLEGQTLALALTLTGDTDGQPLLTKSGMQAGQALILTKAIGTGVLLAAHQQGRTPGRHLDVALNQMDQSNAAAMNILRAHGLTALTDVSGFGLLGHLAEMLVASGTGVELVADQVPMLPGAQALVAQGFHSSLHQQNQEVLDDYRLAPSVAEVTRTLLVDPQTSGGLLATVPESMAVACVSALTLAGYSTAARIGTIRPGERHVVDR